MPHALPHALRHALPHAMPHALPHALPHAWQHALAEAAVFLPLSLVIRRDRAGLHVGLAAVRAAALEVVGAAPSHAELRGFLARTLELRPLERLETSGAPGHAWLSPRA